MKEKIETKLEEMAWEKTTPFCYTCYIDCPDGVCHICGSDDLMRHLPGVGVEYGIEWVCQHLLKDFKEADTEAIFEEMIECDYGQTVKVGFATLDVPKILKTHDAIGWKAAKNEYIDSLMDEGILVSLYDKIYRSHDLIYRL